jgi:hypothetical protein
MPIIHEPSARIIVFVPLKWGGKNGKVGRSFGIGCVRPHGREAWKCLG